MKERNRDEGSANNMTPPSPMIKMGKAGHSFVIRAREFPQSNEYTMKEQPTPETDAFFRSFADGEATPSHAEYYDRLRQLERERDELLEDGLEQARLLGMSGSREARLIAERDEARSEVQRIQHWTTVNGVSDLERERNELLDRLTKLEHSMPEELARLERERDEAREQRDRLVEVFEAAKAFIESHVADPDITPDMAAKYEAYKKSLAAVEGGEYE